MKKNISFLVALFFCSYSFAQNVGIGTSSPQARLHVADSSVVFTAPGGVPGTAGNPPVSGEGRRMMWYPQKGAFRAGYVNSNQWDKDSIGLYSMALGFNTKSTGNYAVAIGRNSIARGLSSVAIGGSAEATADYALALGGGTASGYSSTAMGISSVAWAHSSTAMGNSTKALAFGSTAMGGSTTASGDFATAMGSGTIAYGDQSTAMGSQTYAFGYNSTAMGVENDAMGFACTVLGAYNVKGGIPYNPTSPTPDSPVFIIGNGTPTTASNAMLVKFDGSVGIGTNAPASLLSLDAVGNSNPVMNVNDENPTIQLQSSGVDKGFVQLSGDNIRIGTNSSNTAGQMVVRVGGADQVAVNSTGDMTVEGDIITRGNKGVLYNAASSAGLRYFTRTAAFNAISLQPQTLSAEGTVGISGFTSAPVVLVGDIVTTGGTAGQLYAIKLVVYDVTSTSFKCRMLNMGNATITQNCTWNIVCIGN
jgi:hypothetical protein